MVILPSTKPKKKISKKEAENYLNLSEAFDLIGEKLEGENWHQMRGSHLSYSIVENLNDMMKNDFFDVYDGDDFVRRLVGLKKADLLAEITYSEFLTRIHNRDRNLVVVRQSGGVPSLKITDSMRKAFGEKYEEEKTKRIKSPKRNIAAEDEKSATVLPDEVLEVDYSVFFPKNFLIPKEQFEYVLKTGKRWMDQAPNKEYGDLIISQKQTGFRGLVIHGEMMKVESRDNLLSNFELTDFYQEKFDAEDWEIDLWIFLSQPKELAALRGNDVDSDGYVYLNKQAANSADYTRTFYFKRQVEKLLPERFLDYQGLLGLWQNKFGVNEGKIIKLISHHLSFLDARALLPEEIFFRSSLEITAPLHKEKFTWLSDREVNLEEKAGFIKEAVFGSSYIQAIEEKYFSKLTPKKEVGVESKTEKKKMVIKNESESVIEGSQKKARGGKLINRMIGAIVRSYAHTNEKEVNWSKIISIIKNCNPTNHDEAVVVDFGEAGKFDFGMLKVDTKDLIITWRGDKSKASSSESKYQKKQFYKYHTKILRENGKNF